MTRVGGDRRRLRERSLGRLPRLSDENEDAQSEIGEPEADAGRDIHYSFGGDGGDKSVSDIKKAAFHMRVYRIIDMIMKYVTGKNIRKEFKILDFNP